MPTLFITGSCAEFHWPELLSLLEDFEYAATGNAVDLRADHKKRYKLCQDYSVVVQQFFQERLKRYIELVLKPALGVVHY